MSRDHIFKAFTEGQNYNPKNERSEMMNLLILMYSISIGISLILLGFIIYSNRFGSKKEKQKIERSVVEINFYDPWYLDNWNRKDTILKQWQNASFGKMSVGLCGLNKSSIVEAASHSFTPSQFTENGKYQHFKSFNPYEIAAWIQLKIMGLKKNKFAKNESKR